MMAWPSILDRMKYKCPDPNCQPTDIAPVDVTASGDEVPMAVCGGSCGRTYPKGAFKRVR
jgi:hypothetical protein